MQRSLGQMGPLPTVRTLLRLNQSGGFDCMSCAWPDPDPEHRHRAEFFENGAKAVAEEATKARVTAESFAEHSLGDLLQQPSCSTSGPNPCLEPPDETANCCGAALRSWSSSTGTANVWADGRGYGMSHR